DSQNRFPIGLCWYPPPTINNMPMPYIPQNQSARNLMIEMLPFFEQDNLQKNWSFNPANMGLNLATDPSGISAQVIKILICPSDPLPQLVRQVSTAQFGNRYYGMNSYCGNSGQRSYFYQDMTNDGIFYVNSKTKIADVRDGTSHTIM